MVEVHQFYHTFQRTNFGLCQFSLLTVSFLSGWFLLLSLSSALGLVWSSFSNSYGGKKSNLKVSFLRRFGDRASNEQDLCVKHTKFKPGYHFHLKSWRLPPGCRHTHTHTGCLGFRRCSSLDTHWVFLHIAVWDPGPVKVLKDQVHCLEHVWIIYWCVIMAQTKHESGLSGKDNLLNFKPLFHISKGFPRKPVKEGLSQHPYLHKFEFLWRPELWKLFILNHGPWISSIFLRLFSPNPFLTVSNMSPMTY